MARYSRGDDHAFGDVYDAVAPRLLRYLRRNTGNQARAEDLVQQTLLHIHRARHRFKPGAEVFPWAFGIARHLFLDGLRRDRREARCMAERADRASETATESGPAHQLIEAKQLAARIERELLRMPESQRIAFELVKLDGLSMEQAGQVLGATATAVKVRAHRAYQRLREAIGGDLPEGAIES